MGNLRRDRFFGKIEWISLFTMMVLSVSVIAQPINDNFINSIDISGIINGSSADAAYTNVGATFDQQYGSCSNASGYNVWFKFVATTAHMKITVDRGGSKGTIRRINAALWQADGTTEIGCKRYISNDDDIIVEVVNALTPGQTYYLSVDNNYSGYRGTFTLALADNDISYDYYEGALDISGYINGSSPDAAFTTIGATFDKQQGSCSNASGYNRWFKFAATTAHMKITVDRGDAKGTIRRINAALWQADGTTEVACKRYVSNLDDVVIEVVNALTPGQTYYLSVDNNYSNVRGTFTLALADNDISYDYYEGALDISSIINGSSTDAAYTTIGATFDKQQGSCSNASGYNVWFKFVATTAHMKITVDRGGAKGTIRRINAALWQADGTTEIACKRYISNDDDVVLEVVNTLTPGQTYYVSVDNNNSNYRGTFTLALADNDISYDYYEGATDISGYINGSSPDAAFTTAGATFDKQQGSCSNASGYNVWFKFVATTAHMKITVDRGGAKGTIRRTNAVLWQADGTTEIACKRYISNDDDVVLEVVNTLTPGQTYYVSVDNNNSNYRGTFTLALADNDISYDYYEGATDISGYINGSSPDAAFTTAGATFDKQQGSCSNASGYNVWFKFVATTAHMKITVDRGGAKGTIRRINAALWQADGTTEIACKRYISNDDDVVLEVVNTLTPGQTYYVSVDNNNSNYRGTFTLALADNDISYDYYEGATDISGYINGSSPDAAFTTAGATFDKQQGSCSNASGSNVWFKFVATTAHMKITVDRGGAKGTIRRINAALWQADGTTEIACKRYISNDDDVVLEVVNTLTPGQTYYVSVDNNNSNYRGTFTLALADNDISYDYYEGATDISGYINGSSPDAAFTTAGATFDKQQGSCSNASGYNVWFKFVATTAHMKITVDRGGSKGTIRRINTALWEANGTTEVSCNRYASNNDDVVAEVVNTLIPGQTYYLSVDNNNSSYRGTFTLTLADNDISYDFYEGALEIVDINNWCSTDAAYTTSGATFDKQLGSCSNAGGYNVWFKFTAITDGITINIERGGSKGTIRRINASLWEVDGITEVACKRYVSRDDNVSVEAVNNLTLGQTYYLSVDNNNASYRGTFTLCIDDDPSYDFYDGAYEITNLNNWVSTNAEFTTAGATFDKQHASCFNASGYNRWFKFTAQYSDATILLERGGSKGTIRRANMALWEADGSTQVECVRYVGNNDNLTINTTALTAGNDYYISVDNNYSGYRGTFTLSLSNVAGTYYSRTDGLWNDPNTWSQVAIGGPAAASYPSVGSIVYISDYSITLSNNLSLVELNLDASTGNNSLVVDGATLSVNGKLGITNSGNNVDCNLSLINGAIINVLDDLLITRSGGVNQFGLTMSGSSTININKNMTISSTGGSINNNLVTLSNNSSINITEDLTLSTLSGVKTQISLNNSSSLTVNNDIIFVADGTNLTEIELNDDAILNIKKDIVRGTPTYGVLDFNNNSTLVFLSSDNLQTWSASLGEGTDGFSYANVTINNDKVSYPQITLDGPVSMSGTLTLTKGIVKTSSSSLLTMIDGTNLTGGNSSSFVDGPLKKIGNGDFSFQVGDGNYWNPIEVANLTGDASTEFTAEYSLSAYSDQTILSPDPNGVMTNVSKIEYWDLDNSGTSSNADVTLYWKNQSNSVIDNYADLVVAHYNGSAWENLGQNGIVMSDPGSITVLGVDDFSPFTFGSSTFSFNALPIDLLSFNVELNDNNEAVINWSTATEINNNYFTIERSKDGSDFIEVARVYGAGNSSSIINYYEMDVDPLVGLSYYRLNQTDFDGKNSYSKIVAIENNVLIDVSLYPNPVVNNYLNIGINLTESIDLEIALYNVLGEMVYSTTILPGEGVSINRINIPENLKPGIYQILGSMERITFKRSIVIN